MTRNGFKPREIDLIWARGMMAMIKDGGVLVYPNTRLVYLINHKDKQLVLQNPEELLDMCTEQTHNRTKLVFKEIGYTVIEKTDC